MSDEELFRGPREPRPLTRERVEFLRQDAERRQRVWTGHSAAVLDALAKSHGLPAEPDLQGIEDVPTLPPSDVPPMAEVASTGQGVGVSSFKWFAAGLVAAGVAAVGLFGRCEDPASDTKHQSEPSRGVGLTDGGPVVPPTALVGARPLGEDSARIPADELSQFCITADLPRLSVEAGADATPVITMRIRLDESAPRRESLLVGPAFSMAWHQGRAECDATGSFNVSSGSSADEARVDVCFRRYTDEFWRYDVRSEYRRTDGRGGATEAVNGVLRTRFSRETSVLEQMGQEWQAELGNAAIVPMPYNLGVGPAGYVETVEIPYGRGPTPVWVKFGSGSTLDLLLRIDATAEDGPPCYLGADVESIAPQRSRVGPEEHPDESRRLADTGRSSGKVSLDGQWVIYTGYGGGPFQRNAQYVIRVNGNSFSIDSDSVALNGTWTTSRDGFSLSDYPNFGPLNCALRHEDEVFWMFLGRNRGAKINCVVDRMGPNMLVVSNSIRIGQGGWSHTWVRAARANSFNEFMCYVSSADCNRKAAQDGTGCERLVIDNCAFEQRCDCFPIGEAAPPCEQHCNDCLGRAGEECDVQGRLRGCMTSLQSCLSRLGK